MWWGTTEGGESHHNVTTEDGNMKELNSFDAYSEAEHYIEWIRRAVPPNEPKNWYFYETFCRELIHRLEVTAVENKAAYDKAVNEIERKPDDG